MRVVLDGKALGGVRTGVGRYVEGLLLGLAALDLGGDRVEVARPRRAGSTLAWTAWGLPRAARGADLLHCPFYYAPPAAPCPVVVAVHDLLPVTHPEWFRPRRVNPIRLLLPRSARRAAAVVTFATATAEALEAECGVARERVRVIPHGVDHGRFRPPPPAAVAAVRRRLTGGRPYLLQLGAVEPRRGADLALEAAAAVRRRLADLELVLAGPDRAPVPGLEAAPPWVRRVRWVEEGELPAVYAAAEAVLAPSRGEGFDLPVLEALASGAAVVASDIPPHVEHFGEALAIFPSGDAEALAAAVLGVLEDGERRRRLIAAGLERAARFTWERSAAAHLALWREVAG